jgi:protein YIPF5/7
MAEIPLDSPRKQYSGTGPFSDDPPLLEELEIDLTKIKLKFLAIITQRGFQDNDIATYDDMAGPLLVFIMFGLLELLKGKVEFGNIYGFGLTGCIGVYLIINLLSRRGQYVELYSCMSILGYSLLPMCIIAAISIFYSLN